MRIRTSQSTIVNLWQTEFTMKEFEDYTITDYKSPKKETRRDLDQWYELLIFLYFRLLRFLIRDYCL